MSPISGARIALIMLTRHPVSHFSVAEVAPTGASGNLRVITARLDRR
jgi:hypothetical protein